MRNALLLDENLVLTTDNSGGIGEKSGDIVAVSDRLTAFYAARVTLLEQWAAKADPSAILIHNFSGHASWDKYVQGVKDLFDEAGVTCPPISGSTETNMNLLQSAVAVTIVGKRRQVETSDGEWFTYGTPLVGGEIVAGVGEVARIDLIKQALDEEVISHIWPVGSGGILHEVRSIFEDNHVQVVSELDTLKSAGPSTVVLVKIPSSKLAEAEQKFGGLLRKMNINTSESFS